ncbi:MAG: GldG family protein [Gammaproteobacteria bacterium]|nr:GldG family protein [Gammaproteobacteria bacterium]
MVGLIAWLSTRYTYQADWSANNRNSLSDASISLLKVIDGPVKITSYAKIDESLRRQINNLITLYQYNKNDIDFMFVNPETEPDKTRELGVSVNGELIIEYEGRRENIKQISEQAITNALQRIVRGKERWIVFLEGHGERSIHRQANHDVQAWATQLEDKGFNLQTINLANSPQIPDNATVLILASPQVSLLAGEIQLIADYIKRGGNLLWLSDPFSRQYLKSIAELLGIEYFPGMIVDPTTQLFGINDPRFAIVADYGRHPITQNFTTISLFPQAVGLDVDVPSGWDAEPFLQSVERSWSETDEIEGNVKFDKGRDIPGPLTIGVAFNRLFDENEEDGAIESEAVEDKMIESKGTTSHEQRIVVVGDGDFLSNSFLGNGGNLDLGLSIINWLSHDDTFIAMPVKTAQDLNLELSRTAQIVIGFGFLLVLPAILAGCGILIWLKRRKQ